MLNLKNQKEIIKIKTKLSIEIFIFQVVHFPKKYVSPSKDIYIRYLTFK